MSRCSSTVQIGERRKERKKGRKLERGNRANREIQSNYRRNTSELENKVLSLVLPFSDVTRLFVWNVVFLAKKSRVLFFLSFFFSISLWFLPVSFDRWKRRTLALKALRVIIMTDILNQEIIILLYCPEL